eukprot:3327472-Ditylum_brightwellii.AAC.1
MAWVRGWLLQCKSHSPWLAYQFHRQKDFGDHLQKEMILDYLASSLSMGQVGLCQWAYQNIGMASRATD